MALSCPRCERTLADSVDAAPPLFCMYCGQKLRSSGDDDLTLPPIVMPDPPSADPDEGVVTRSQGSAGGSTVTESETAPARVAGFRLLRFLGAGGMGTVYEAEADGSGQKVAVKLLARRLASNPASVERFRQEGRLASQISHPRCVFVLRADTDAGRPFIVMELMPGKTLKDEIDETGPMPVEVAVGHILDVIDGLIEAHRLGVIHRDVKPSNCFLTDDGRVKVGDFGLSKSLGPDAANPKHQTGSGAFLGTVLFASPEQIRGEAVGYDSDVYAVSATLYYLLIGRAPHQHDSLTAALARAISEAAPPLRPKRPDVSVELERAVLRGLDRDRGRRFTVLEELRDALVAVLPARQIPARPQSLFLAYLIDTLLLQLVVIPAQVIHQSARDPESVRVSLFDLSWVGLIVTVVYFWLAEGLFGTTLGKRSMRLRVVKLGETGPPGLPTSAARIAAYTAVWLFMFNLPGVLFEQVGGWFAGVSGLTFIGIGLAVLCRQLWRSQHGYRGVHDFASGTRTVQLPRPPHRLRLVSHFPNPLDQPAAADRAAPEAVGGFAIGGLVCQIGDGSELWVGEDGTLGRRVLIRVQPVGAAEYHFDSLPEPRAYRLRVIGYGVTAWGPDRRPWIAYVAPAGAPLPDVVSPAAPLGWAESRPVLEQVVAELVAAEADGDDAPLSPEQIWVEPNGRVQVLDFPLPTGRELAEDRTKSRYPLGVAAPLDGVRAVATLMLEGTARTTGGRVAAPLPPHASAITDRLMTDGRAGYPKLSHLARDLAENHALPPQVTAGLRAGHLTVQAMLCAFGLLVMFLFAGFYSFSNALVTMEEARLPARVKSAVADPAQRAAAVDALRTNPSTDPKVLARVEALLAPDQLDDTLRKLDEWAAAADRRLRSTDPHLNDPERRLIEQIARVEPGPDEAPAPRVIAFAVTAVGSPRPPDLALRVNAVSVWWVFGVIAVFPLLVWPLFAVIFRGGLSMIVTGIAAVTTDGRPAARWRCAVREAVGWLPLLAVLLAAAWVQYAVPQYVFARTFLWLLAVAVLPLSVAVAVRDPRRAPHDRLLRTHLVPR